mgnify:CR=1 FL=1
MPNCKDTPNTTPLRHPGEVVVLVLKAPPCVGRDMAFLFRSADESAAAFNAAGNTTEALVFGQCGVEPCIYKFIAASFVSVYVNTCFLVVEVMMITHGPQGNNRRILEALAHIMSGPIAFLAFFQGDFLGSLLFFLSIWHFMCDTGHARPSYFFLFPCKRLGLPLGIWLESFWTLLHHMFIGTFKIAMDMGFIRDTISDQLPWVQRFALMWIGGATLSHLSMGMSMFDIQFCWHGDSSVLRFASVALRIGAAATLAFAPDTWTQAPVGVQAAMVGDLLWMTVMILFVGKNVLFPPSEEDLCQFLEHELEPQPGDERLSVAERLERRHSLMEASRTSLSRTSQVHCHRVMRP